MIKKKAIVITGAIIDVIKALMVMALIITRVPVYHKKGMLGLKNNSTFKR